MSGPAAFAMSGPAAFALSGPAAFALSGPAAFALSGPAALVYSAMDSAPTSHHDSSRANRVGCPRPHRSVRRSPASTNEEYLQRGIHMEHMWSLCKEEYLSCRHRP